VTDCGVKMCRKKSEAEMGYEEGGAGFQPSGTSFAQQLRLAFRLLRSKVRVTPSCLNCRDSTGYGCILTSYSARQECSR
jgi:hypothetical protein